jgi:hypothetical protein
MGGGEGKLGRRRGQPLPHRTEEGGGVSSEKAMRRRDEPALGRLDALGE